MNQLINSAVIAYCRKCERNTATALILLSSGHWGNSCDHCRTLRKFKPYASLKTVNQATKAASAAKGEAPCQNNQNK